MLIFLKNESSRNSLKYFYFIGIEGDGSWGLLSAFFLILFLSGILTQSAILYHITQTTHDLVLNSTFFKSSHIAFWRLAVGICLTIGLLTLIDFISVSIEQYYEGHRIFNSSTCLRKIILLILYSYLGESRFVFFG